MEKNNKEEELKKKVDEAWKESVEKEIEGSQDSSAKEIEVTFGLFISGLMMEALIALGEVENPVTKTKESNQLHAKFIIDTLGMLEEKTKNNLSKEEQDALEALLYDLRMRFVEKTKKP